MKQRDQYKNIKDKTQEHKVCKTKVQTNIYCNEVSKRKHKKTKQELHSSCERDVCDTW
jgi:hypothetical protein